MLPSQQRLAAAACLALALAAASCASLPGEEELAPADVLSEPAEPPERTGEVEQPWTGADCYAAWKHNMELCNGSPPNLRPECWAAASALLAVCLAAAE